ncbi:patatin-like phospholipase family protein [Rhodoferax sp.]|uniref:patatin-like phospholipase family protein n=1 Tax=Rhodoferax sp. TaxID=50421 RepID=UPI00260024D9|nr:patatin-like phospholipase family protein [Rhodoferax sp.]
MTTDYPERVLNQYLQRMLSDVDAEAIALLRRHLQWFEVAAGEALMRQGEPGDAMYLSISGRLRASVRGDDGVEHMVREMGRGEIIGEMSLYTDEPRSATVVAIRDSLLVRLAKSEFASLLASSAHMSILLTRQMIKRLTSSGPRTAVPPPVAMALLPVTAGVDAADFAQRLATQLGHMGKVCLADADSVDAALQQPGLARSAVTDMAANRRIVSHLDELELTHDFVLLVGDAGASAWTQRCSRHSDEILLLANANQPPVPHETETACLMQRGGQNDAAQILVLMHEADVRSPSGTREWLARRPVADHVHVRPTLAGDMARLARIQSRTAVGLVLAGGGAKGLAHLGLYQALQERGIVIDFVGGTSIGAIMAAMVASDQPLASIMPIARAAFADKPTGDFNLLPLISLIRGRRMRRILQVALQQVFGHPADIEDAWKNFFCVASNYTEAREQVISQGSLAQALLATSAIPGAFPPVPVAGDLLFDGGTFNNFPVSIMRKRRGVGKVIGMDLGVRRPKPVAFDEVPGTWALLRDRLRPRQQRRYKLPSFMAYLLNVNIMYSNSRQGESRRLTDLYFSPPLERVGMLQWQRFDSIAKQGYDYAREVLDAQTDEQLRALRSRA